MLAYHHSSRLLTSRRRPRRVRGPPSSDWSSRAAHRLSDVPPEGDVPTSRRRKARSFVLDSACWVSSPGWPHRCRGPPRAWFTIPASSSAGLGGRRPRSRSAGFDRLVRGPSGARGRWSTWFMAGRGQPPVAHRWSDRWWRPVIAVVAFDGPSHGRSDPGASGPGRSHAVEFADALAAVAARHGPARAVVAHSMGAMATMLTLRDSRLSAERLVFVAPMRAAQLSRPVRRGLNLGRRARHRLDASLGACRNAGRGVRAAEHGRAGRTPPCWSSMARDDRRLAWAEGVELVDRWPDARLVTTEGLGPQPLLGDPAVHAEIVRFVSP